MAKKTFTNSAPMAQPDNPTPSISLFRLVGYGLLLLALLDFAATVIPPRFTDPAWELQTIGTLVDRMPVPLLGFILVFYGKGEVRRKSETKLLGSLSWVALLVGVLLLLMIPLGISDFLRINKQTNTQIQEQSTQQITRLNQLEQQINQATGTQLQNFATRLNRQGSGQDPETLRKQLLSEANKAEATVRSQAKATQTSRRNSLLKNIVKWELGALISGILCIYIWRATRWARRPRKWRR